MHPRHETPPPLHPERALLTPTWLGAVALLVANDHWLKGADLIPGVLTGKISDFAGMLVAPVLLATLLRVRSRRGLLACHVAVLAVFAGIQLSTGFAALWSSAMGLLGHPWAITCDPTDLIALPFLYLSWTLLTPAMDAERPALIGLRRSAAAAASVFGLWATVATSDDSSADDSCGDCGNDDWGTDDGTDGGGGWEEIEGQVFIHNPNAFAINLNIRTLRPEVAIDCAAIASDPGRLLPDDAFGEAEHWELPPTTNVGVWMLHDCGAAKITGEGIPEQIIFSDSFTGVRWFPGSLASLTELGPSGAAIVMSEVGTEWIGGEQWRHTPNTDSVPQPEECMADPGERPLDWSAVPAAAVVEVQSLAAGLDGCSEIGLLPWAGENYGEPFTWYLCAPEPSIRLEVGEFFRITTTLPDLIEATLVDPISHAVLEDDLGRVQRTLQFGRRQTTVAYIAASYQAVPTDLPDCPWNVTDTCVEVTRALEVTLDDIAVEPGVPAIQDDQNGMRHELILGRARALALTSGDCGDAQIPYDIDYALVSEPTP
jgi:hypothetical protein